MVTIHIRQMKMHAFHGVYKEEQITGSNYLIDLDVTFEERRSRFDGLDDTISYVELIAIIKKKMQAAAALLETVADGIVRKIKHEYSSVSQITLSIYKLDAPIENFEGRVGITLKKKFDD